MATKLTNLTLEELSLVDSPANKDARVTIFKRDSVEKAETKREDGKDFPASDFAYVPDPAKPSTWKLRLTSTPGGDPDPRIVGAAAAALGPGFRGEKVEIPEGARAKVVARVRAAWRKANPGKKDDQMPEGIRKCVEIDRIAKAIGAMTKAEDAVAPQSFGQLMQENERRRRMAEASQEIWPMFSALQGSIRSILAAEGLGQRERITRIARSVEEFMNAVADKVPDVEEELEKLLKSHPASAGFFDAGNRAGDHIGKTGGIPMPDGNKTVADLTKQVADLDSVDELKKLAGDLAELAQKAETDKAEAEALAKMSDAERVHMATLKDDQAKKDFMAMMPEDRQSAMKKSADDDEIVKVGGQEIRKSVVGDAQFAVIKAQQDEITKQAEEIKKERDERQMAELKKRADDDFAHVPGTVDERAAMLKAMGGMDETVRKSFEAVLTAHEKLAKSAFTTVGHGNGDVASGSAEEKLDKLAKAHAEKNSVSFAKAYDAVVQTDEGRELYNQSRAEKSAAAA